MVLVFDTDDRDGCKSSLKIMKQLAQDYNFEGIMANYDDPRFGKIEFIKMLKDFDAYSQLPDTERNPEGASHGGGHIRLRALKHFADHVWDEKKNNSYYKPKWLKR
jgi:hypothetical protein